MEESGWRCERIEKTGGKKSGKSGEEKRVAICFVIKTMTNGCELTTLIRAFLRKDRSCYQSDYKCSCL